MLRYLEELFDWAVGMTEDYEEYLIYAVGAVILLFIVIFFFS